METAAEKAGYIRDNREQFGSISAGCKVMKMSRSSFYERSAEKEIKRKQSDLEIKNMIEVVHSEFPGYGYRRLHHHFARCGITINGKRLRRIMRQYGVHPVRFRKFIATTDSKHANKIYPNLLKKQPLHKPDQAWISDITYIRIKDSFIYLAVILDSYSRKVVGWSLSKKIDSNLTVEALKMAISRREPEENIIHHSDRGVQYTCGEYISILKNHGFKISMSRKGNPYDNARCESFMKTLKYEEVHLWGFDTFQDVLDRVPVFIEEVYNRKRLHSSLGYLPPEEFEKNFRSSFKIAQF